MMAALLPDGGLDDVVVQALDQGVRMVGLINKIYIYSTTQFNLTVKLTTIP